MRKDAFKPLINAVMTGCFMFSIIIMGFGEDGYRLWLRFDKIENPEIIANYSKLITGISIAGNSEVLRTAGEELQMSISKMLDNDLSITNNFAIGELIIGVKDHDKFKNLNIPEIADIEEEGYLIGNYRGNIVIIGGDDRGVLYGAFHLLKSMKLNQDIKNIEILENPKIKLRLLNHWDNLDRTVERGYAGFSIWNWHELPEYTDQRYFDYARANASIGINGAVVTNVNANALIFRDDYIEKFASLADIFRKYGLKIYLTARFSAPIDLGGLQTADPLDPQVKQWWKERVAEIYAQIPDFGGFLVKANSEGQPGPQNYGRSHADGANMLADALKPYGGVVMWRAFVYSNEEPEDRAKQAYNEFVPLDGTFRNNVLIQVKNGPIDFQPREPIHPLFGAMPETPIMMEFQVTKEYLGQGTHLVGLASMYKEVLDTDTYVKGKGSTVASVIDGSLHGNKLTGMAGVANIGTARNWTGNLFGQADWYGLGKLAWNPYTPAKEIFEEWSSLTFDVDDSAQKTIVDLLEGSHETCVKYMTPLGLHHIMAAGHHFGPGPWVSNMPRADWTSVYYHKADEEGLGFDRTISGSNALEQYDDLLAAQYADPEKCSLKYLLWFHHISWDKMLSTGRTLWVELCYQYHEGAAEVKEMKDNWASLKNKIDQERHRQVEMHLTIQEKEAKWWRDACLAYFQSFSKREIPADLEKPAHELEYYISLQYAYAPGIRPRW